MPGFNRDTTGATDQNVLYADNVDFSGSTAPVPKVTTNGQLLIGSTATPNIKIGNITSPLGTITIGYSSPNITLDLTGGMEAIDSIGVDTTTGAGTNPVVPTILGLVTLTGGQYTSGTFGTRVITINSQAANNFEVLAQISSAVASSTITKNGFSHFNSSQISVDPNGFVSLLPNVLNYTNVTHAMSPYTVLTTDYYISVDCSGGVVTLNFPNAPTFKQEWIVKDRTGNSAANNITITTPGGTVTFDGQTSLIMDNNYMSLNLVANTTPTYEVF